MKEASLNNPFIGELRGARSFLVSSHFLLIIPP
jgi:hypothetical protein